MATSTSSANISILDSKVTVNLATGNIIVNITPSTFTGAGATLVQGASVSIVNAVGVTIKSFPATGFDILPPMTSSVTTLLPLVGANYLYGDYVVTVKLKDALGVEYTDVKNVNICPPNQNDKSQKQGCLGVEIIAKCNENKVIISAANPPIYKATQPTSTVYALTVVYPTVSQLAPLTSTIANFSVAVFEGEYITKGTVTVTYSFGNNIFYIIPYKVNTSKQVRCQVDECCLQRYLDSLYAVSQTDCSSKEKETTGELIGQALFLKELSIGAQNCGNDPSEYIQALESLSGYVCSCDCGTSTPVVANNTPVTDVNITGCNVVRTIVGNTKNYNIENYAYEVFSSDGSVQVGAPVLDAVNCKIKQDIKSVSSAATRQFKIILNQSGTNAPVITTLVNTSLSTITAAYISVGEYSISFTGVAFNALQTFVLVNVPSGVVISVRVSSPTQITIKVNGNGDLLNTSLLIETFN